MDATLLSQQAEYEAAMDAYETALRAGEIDGELDELQRAGRSLSDAERAPFKTETEFQSDFTHRKICKKRLA